SSQSPSNTGTLEFVAASTMSAPATAARADSTGRTSIFSISLISLANAARCAASRRYTLIWRSLRIAANASRCTRACLPPPISPSVAAPAPGRAAGAATRAGRGRGAHTSRGGPRPQAGHDVCIRHFGGGDVADDNAVEVSGFGIEQGIDRLRATLRLLHVGGRADADAERAEPADASPRTGALVDTDPHSARRVHAMPGLVQLTIVRPLAKAEF